MTERKKKRRQKEKNRKKKRGQSEKERGGDIPDWQTRQCLNKDDKSNPPNMV